MHYWGNTILLCALVSSVSKRDADDVTITLNLQAYVIPTSFKTHAQQVTSTTEMAPAC